MICVQCGTEFLTKGYTVSLNILMREGEPGWRLEERLCSEKCGIEYKDRVFATLRSCIIVGGRSDRAS